MDRIPKKPFGEVESLRKEMEKLWDRFLGDTPLGRGRGTAWLPQVDVSESGNMIELAAELPGLEPGDVSVSISGDMLTIKGEKKREREEKDEKQHFVERYFGSFERSFRLPAEVQADKVEARFKNGVLKVSLPKSEEAKTKEVKIQVT